jgi:hypothetical protein
MWGAFENLHTGSMRNLSRGDALSEMVLWTCWVHAGNLVATGDCLILQMSPSACFQTMQTRIDSSLVVAKYAQQYVKQMNCCSDRVSDLFKYSPDGGYEDSEDMQITHAIFLSHYKVEAGTEATLMQEAFGTLLKSDGLASSVFLDSEDLTDLTTLRNHVMNSRSLVFLLTPGVLSRPWCLMEIVTAVQHGVYIVPVVIERPGLQFSYPTEEFYSKLREKKLLESKDIQLLDAEGISLDMIEQAIRTVFQSIALPFSPHKSKKVRDAELADIVRRCMSLHVSLKRSNRMSVSSSSSDLEATTKEEFI